MPYYEGQTGQTTRRARGGGRQSDLLMQQLGTSTSDSPKDSAPSNDFEALGFDNNSTTSSAPLTFDASTDTRVGRPRKRRGNGSHLGNASSQQQAQARPHAAGMIRNDEEVARRQQIIQDVASEDMFSPSSRRPQATTPRPAAVAEPSRPTQVPPARRNAEPQPSGPVMGISNDPSDASPDEGQSVLGANPLTQRIREMRGRHIINPITFIRDNGGGVETFGIWLYEYRQIFVILAIVFLIVGMLFNRYYSLIAGIAIVFVGMWLDRIDDNNDSFLVYLCGIVTALFPFLMPA